MARTLAGIVGLGEVAVNLSLGPVASDPVMILGSVVALALMIWIRAVYRVLRERVEDPHRREGRIRTIVVGAGDAPDQLLRSMGRDPRRTWHPVALVDDDRGKWHRRPRSIVGNPVPAEFEQRTTRPPIESRNLYESGNGRGLYSERQSAAVCEWE